MYEKILQKLKMQRGQKMSISDKTLEGMAKSYEAFITTDEILNACDFTGALDSIVGNISHIAAEAAKNAAEKAKKELEDAGKNPPKPADPPKTDDMPEWAKSLLDPIKQLTDKVTGMEREKTVLTRKQIIESKLKETPDIYRNAVLKTFDRATFKDEEDFNSFVAEIEAETVTVIQEGREKGLVFPSPGKNPAKPDPEGVTPEMEKTLKALTEIKEIKKPY